MYEFDTTSNGVNIVMCAFALHLMHNYLHRMHLKDLGVAICQFPVCTAKIVFQYYLF